MRKSLKSVSGCTQVTRAGFDGADNVTTRADQVNKEQRSACKKDFASLCHFFAATHFDAVACRRHGATRTYQAQLQQRSRLPAHLRSRTRQQPVPRAEAHVSATRRQDRPLQHAIRHVTPE
jgi:hypothetical protein